MTVVLVTLDGVRPDALQQCSTPHLDQVMAEGAYTLKAQSVMPSMTLPCHISIFHSVPPERHGILSNEYHPMARPLPGLFEQIHMSGKRSASFLSWDVLRDVARPLNVSFTLHIEMNYSDLVHSDDPLVEAAVPVLQAHTYDFVFVYLGSVDEVGHVDGWMSAPYLRQVEILDGYIGQLRTVLNADDYLLIEADHGGHDRTHGTDSPEDMNVPWLVCGPNIRRGHEIQSDVSLLNTAPTLAHMLNMPIPDVWDGIVVKEIFK